MDGLARLFMSFEPAPEARPVGLQYTTYWPAVAISENAAEKIRNCEILYSGFGIALQATLTHILDEVRRAKEHKPGVRVMMLMPMEDVPEGLKLSYIYDGTTLKVADLWTPVQPRMF